MKGLSRKRFGPRGREARYDESSFFFSTVGRVGDSLELVSH